MEMVGWEEWDGLENRSKYKGCKSRIRNFSHPGHFIKTTPNERISNFVQMNN